MAIAGYVNAKNNVTNALFLRGQDGDAPGQRVMCVEGNGFDLIEVGAFIWGGASSVEITNPGDETRHLFNREGYTRLVYDKSLPAPKPVTEEEDADT
jgi:hypothetical protein